MKTIINILIFVFFFLFLTIITQVGGVILLLCLPIFKFINRKESLNKWKKYFLKIGLYTLIYSFFSLIIVPIIAKQFGRIPLPNSKNIQALNKLTCILNRHYVHPNTLEVLKKATQEFQKKYPNAIICYLDANFPFLDGFPLLPHLSHKDGKKLDIAFFYTDKNGNEVYKKAISWLGYGGYEKSKQNEFNTTKYCKKQGYWQYDYPKYLNIFSNNNLFFDNKKNKHFIEILANQKSVQKIFIEPHLKTRMQLINHKIRFHGCKAVRHDDHIHFQVY